MKQLGILLYLFSHVTGQPYPSIKCYVCQDYNRELQDCLDTPIALKGNPDYTVDCKWMRIHPKGVPGSVGFLGLPLKPYCVTFMETIRNQDGSGISSRMVRDCAHPGGNDKVPPPKCYEFNNHPKVFLPKNYDSIPETATVLRRAIFCDTDNCNTIKYEQMLTECYMDGKFRSVQDSDNLRDLTGVEKNATSDSQPRFHYGRMATLIGLSLSGLSTFHRLPPTSFMALSMVTGAVIALSQAVAGDSVPELICWNCNTGNPDCKSEKRDTAGSPAGMTIAEKNALAAMKKTIKPDWPPIHLTADIGMVMRMEPYCSITLQQQWKGADLLTNNLIRSAFLAEKSPDPWLKNGCIDLTDTEAVNKQVLVKNIVYVCQTNLCNGASLDAHATKCFYELTARNITANDSVLETKGDVLTVQVTTKDPKVNAMIEKAKHTPPRPTAPITGHGHSAAMASDGGANNVTPSEAELN